MSFAGPILTESKSCSSSRSSSTARNIYDPIDLHKLGFTYYSIRTDPWLDTYHRRRRIYRFPSVRELSRARARRALHGQLLDRRQANIGAFLKNPRFRFIDHNVSRYIEVPEPLDLSCISLRRQVRWIIWNCRFRLLKVGALGTHNALGLAKAKGAVFLLASTSEVYGDPLVRPQTEEYWGNVNPIGPRGVYDEANVSPRR